MGFMKSILDHSRQTSSPLSGEKRRSAAKSWTYPNKGKIDGYPENNSCDNVKSDIFFPSEQAFAMVGWRSENTTPEHRSSAGGGVSPQANPRGRKSVAAAFPPYAVDWQGVSRIACERQNEDMASVLLCRFRRDCDSGIHGEENAKNGETNDQYLPKTTQEL
jgi:hypothetical protein